jgi:hypothetical protein
LAGEGFVAHSPDRSEMLAELIRVVREAETPSFAAAWRFISNQKATVDTLTSSRAISSLVNRTSPVPFKNPGFKPATP